VEKLIACAAEGQRHKVEASQPMWASLMTHETEVLVKTFRCLAALITLLIVTAACSQTTSVFELNVGDCFKDPGGGNIAEVEVVFCEDTHDLEVFFIDEIEQVEEYPGRNYLADYSENICDNALATYTPPAGYLTADITSAYPSPQQWQDGERSVVCVVRIASG